MPDPLDTKIATREDIKDVYAEGVQSGVTLFQDTVKRLTESRDACQVENSRLALAKQELSGALDEALKDRDHYDNLYRMARAERELAVRHERDVATRQNAALTKALEQIAGMRPGVAEGDAARTAADALGWQWSFHRGRYEGKETK